MRSSSGFIAIIVGFILAWKGAAFYLTLAFYGERNTFQTEVTEYGSLEEGKV